MTERADLTQLARTRLWGVRSKAVGGASWAVTRRTGDGMGRPRPGASAGTVAGYLWQDTAARVAQALPGTPAPSAPWRFARTGGVALAAGDELDDGAGVRCTVKAATGEVTLEVWEAERR